MGRCHVKQLSIRGIPGEVERIIREEARQKGVSLNKAVIAVLEKAGGIRESKPKKARLHHDLDHLCGIWNKREANEMKRHIGLHREIDEALWKR